MSWISEMNNNGNNGKDCKVNRKGLKLYEGSQFNKRKEGNTYFGPHLMIDGYGCPKEKLNDVTTVYKFLDEIPDKIGMTKIMPPYVFRYEGIRPEDWGISGIVLIAESHISVHTFAEKGYFNMDIFSCKDFDVKDARDYVLKYFGATSCEENFLMRGREFPKDIRQSIGIIKKEREIQSVE